MFPSLSELSYIVISNPNEWELTNKYGKKKPHICQLGVTT